MPIKTVTAAAIAFMLGAAVAVQAAATLTVSRRGLMLSKSSATIAKGDRIVFTNEDDVIQRRLRERPRPAETARDAFLCVRQGRQLPGPLQYSSLSQDVGDRQLTTVQRLALSELPIPAHILRRQHLSLICGPAWRQGSGCMIVGKLCSAVAPMPKKWPFRRRRSRSFTVPRELEGSDRCYCSRAENLIMCVHSKSASVMFRGVALALAVLFYVGDAVAQNNATVGSAPSTDPFAQLAGSWSGSGTIDLSNGRHEPIKCRASYDVLEEQSKLQLDIRCASDNYNFNLRASATYAAGAITGVWSESTRNAAGTLSGKVEGVGFQVVAKGPTFTANLNLATLGDKQSVTIRSQDGQASVQGATISLQRG